ncbi:hypothetical protein DYBT9623_05359 [Dyadobacter sp. CECT 9623]|uniref:DNA 3'-5' helicase II n=1 Tax=Dyadobacter linearis TaxID=2823330 RepID=A0ABM8UYC4_9BACT|nr:ATP-binding domain-containing protein [Dyadobacter sp. CECT 9623]CAG5074672.1 hypothetical protein DYBT9623_05359 [Dyadobacter sp. CECT 9623]
MNVTAFEGPAGCGKTFTLIQRLEQKIEQVPMSPNQKILALTYMHGSRKRLSTKLSGINSLRGRFDCLTVDSLAAFICRRWGTLQRNLNLGVATDDDYDGQCSNASELLARPDVQAWFRMSYPFVVIDEAQDLCAIRTLLISSIAQSTNIFVALDEFQCLDSKLRPNPAFEWLHTQCTPTSLTIVHRTNDVDLLNAALAIREGRAPISRRNFQFSATQGLYVAAAAVAYAIAFGKTADVAIIIPSLSGGFAVQVINRVKSHASGARKLGPYNISLEQSDLAMVDSLIENLPHQEIFSYHEAVAFWQNHPKGNAICRSVGSWLLKQKRVKGTHEFLREEIVKQVNLIVTRHRNFASHDRTGFKAMTVHQAKNREFDGVIVLWPYTVAGNSEAKRRLLYNAVTRAKHWCKVFVQHPSILSSSPFAVN